MRRVLSLSRSALVLSIAIGLTVCGSALHAQVSAITPRITAPIDETSLVTLKGNVTSLARAQFDRGEAAPATELTGVRLVLSRSREQEAALEQYMAQQLDKSSPNYHRWLTPEQFGRLYGPADSDIAVIEAWLQSHGLRVEPVSPGRTNIAFSGSVTQIEEAFHIQVHSFNANGRQFYSNTTNPRIPSALASVVAGVAQLNTLQPRSHAVPATPGRYDPQSKRFTSATDGASGVRPALTTGTVGSQSLYVVAGDAATIYNTPNSFNAKFSSGSSYTGQGVTIGIGGDGLIQASTVVNYRKLFLGDSTAPTITNVLGTAVANGDTDEAYLDNEIAGALAPGAAINFYVSSSLQTAIDSAINHNNVDIFSLSFGACELSLTTSQNQLINSLWQQAASQGIAVVVSTGDSGSAGCDDPSSEQVATDGLQVSGFSSTPYNIAVGGTDYYGLLNGGFSTYVDSTNSASTFYRTAKSYIPEATWNDSVQSNGLISANVPYVDSTSKTNIVGGTGGASSCSTNTTNSSTTGTCTSGYAKPSWQRGTGVPNDGVRDVPDVSLMAGNGFDAAAWLVCTDDVSSGVTSNCVPSGGSFNFAGFGGTSASTPAFAGILALVQQKVGGRLGADGAKILYDLFNGAHASAVFHDTTQGNNSVPCTTGTPNCTQNLAGYYFLSGYPTGTGYDLATGLGSVDATQLITYWGAATGSTASTVTVTPSATAILTTQALTVNVTVAGSSGTPTGTVTLSGGGYTGSAVTLVAGAATITIPANSLSVGTDALTVTYSGDATYASTTGTASVTVTAPVLLTPSVSVTPASTTIDSSQSLSVAVAITGTGGAPSGTVTLSGGGYTGSAVTLVAGAATITIPANSLSIGTDTLTVSYSGDSVYAAGTGTATVTVTTPQSLFSLTATTPASISAGGSATSTITVSSTTGYAGSVSLSCALATSPSGATNVPTCSVTGSPVTLTSSVTSATATVNIATTAATAQMQRPRIGGWLGAGSGTALALLVFFGIPARRRNWRAMLGMLALLVTLGSLSACGGGSSSGGGGTSIPGTTSGTYTFTVTGTVTPSVPLGFATATITLTVN